MAQTIYPRSRLEQCPLKYNGAEQKAAKLFAESADGARAALPVRLWRTGAREWAGPAWNIYYFVPGLRRHFTSAKINSLIAPRAHLSTIGLYDGLAPQIGVDRIEAELKQVYAQMGAEDRLFILRYPVGHRETAEARADVLAFIRKHLQDFGTARAAVPECLFRTNCGII